MPNTTFYLNQLKNKGVVVSFNHVGVGNKTLFTFAGVGMDERYFTKYFKQQEDKHQFFHFSIEVIEHIYKKEIPKLWVSLINSILEEYEIERFDIIAYSIGSRLTYPLFQNEKLNQITLICPDGVIEHPIYSFATQTFLGGLLFYPVFSAIRFIVPSIRKFIKLSSKELFYLWKLYSVFTFPQSLPLKTTVYLALNDYICPHKKIHKTLKNNNLDKALLIKANHFSILSIISKNIISEIK